MTPDALPRLTRRGARRVARLAVRGSAGARCDANSPVTKLGVCNLCEAICGLRITLEAGAVTGGPGQPRRPALARAHLPQGRRDRRHPRRPGPVASTRTARPRHRRVDRDRLGRGLRPRRRRPGRGDQRHGAGRGRDLPRQPQRAQPGLDDPRHRAGQGAAHPQHLQRHLRRPAPPPAGRAPDVRPPAAAADPRHRPHRPLPGLRRQPDGLQRVADDRARLPAAGCASSSAAAAGWSCSTRAAPRPRRSPPSTTSSGPGTDAWVLLAMLHVLFADGLADRSRLRRRAGRRSRPRSRDFTPERAAAKSGVPADEIRRIARELAAAEGAVAYGRVGVSTHEFGSVCQWAVNLLNILTGNLDREGGAMFTSPAIDVVGRGLIGRGHHGAWRSPGPRPARDGRRAAGLGAARGDRDPRRRPDPGDADPRGQPGAVHPRRRPPRRGAGRAGLHGRGRHLPQRDHPARRRRSCRRPRRWSATTTTSSSRRSPCATPPASPRPCCRPGPGTPARLADLPRARAAHRRAPGPAAVASQAARAPGPDDRQPDAARPAPARSAAGPASPCASSGPSPPASTWARCAAACCPNASRPVTTASTWPRRWCSTTSPASPPSRPRPRASCCSSAAATSRTATPGCTTSSGSPGAGHATTCSCTPTTSPPAGSRTASTVRVELAGRHRRGRGGGDRGHDARASSASPTATGTPATPGCGPRRGCPASRSTTSPTPSASTCPATPRSAAYP